ncbi:TetR/AcrR family transcriptional regulator [Ruegeria conchae]|uniref:TetR/AcrR family transcriptional regulator n=1 Tax=Ruegeria conchae TaxID=981384 RepID=UPI0021A52D2A|nr:TetR/AcrR family transcriptional regulator [Ruegeria conchae]UWR01821.1 TetR/AcrR family transcriptional regulator [Ruegeria conchae]
MTSASEESKTAAILSSAFRAFAAYGFRKTSMDDIAKGAGMSRPAVYLHYKNKEAIVRELTQYYYDEKVILVAEALAGEGSLPEILAGAVQAQSQGMAEILASPHGLEMLDATKSMSTDIVQEGEVKLTRLYADWLRRENSAGRAHLPVGPDEAAKTITTSLKGIKMTASSAEEFEQGISQLATLLGAALEIR